jgi:hypothetical protein
MGITFSFLPFFDRCHRRRALQSPLLALGSLEIHEPAEQILAFGKKHGYQNLLRDQTVRSLLLDRYSIEQYQDCDINDQADIHLDLNFAVDQNLAGSAATILDGGTLEHLFDIRQVFANIHQLVQTGGTVIHISPLTWFNHGLYNFNPKLFKGLIQANGYGFLVEAYWIPATPKRFLRQEMGPQIFITFDGQEDSEAIKTMEKHFHHHLLPTNALYMIAYKKERDDPFQYPYDM